MDDGFGDAFGFGDTGVALALAEVAGEGREGEHGHAGFDDLLCEVDGVR